MEVLCIRGHAGLSGEECDLTQDPRMGRSRYIWVSHVNSEGSKSLGKDTSAKMGYPISPGYRGLEGKYLECGYI